MKESAEKPEGHHESKGILGTLRDMLTPENLSKQQSLPKRLKSNAALLKKTKESVTPRRMLQCH
uniref:Uncharacterized protein n=1 Tax=Daphnia galeata TaxID=27404 RepID=A0A8J2RTN6_9CRUS|nr:unnamed protein product [Daphnia galeata]